MFSKIHEDILLTKYTTIKQDQKMSDLDFKNSNVLAADFGLVGTSKISTTTCLSDKAINGLATDAGRGIVEWGAELGKFIKQKQTELTAARSTVHPKDKKDCVQAAGLILQLFEQNSPTSPPNQKLLDQLGNIQSSNEVDSIPFANINFTQLKAAIKSLMKQVTQLVSTYKTSIKELKTQEAAEQARIAGGEAAHIKQEHKRQKNIFSENRTGFSAAALNTHEEMENKMTEAQRDMIQAMMIATNTLREKEARNKAIVQKCENDFAWLMTDTNTKLANILSSTIVGDKKRFCKFLGNASNVTDTHEGQYREEDMNKTITDLNQAAQQIKEELKRLKGFRNEDSVAKLAAEIETRIGEINMAIKANLEKVDRFLLECDEFSGRKKILLTQHKLDLDEYTQGEAQYNKSEQKKQAARNREIEHIEVENQALADKRRMNLKREEMALKQDRANQKAWESECVSIQAQFENDLKIAQDLAKAAAAEQLHINAHNKQLQKDRIAALQEDREGVPSFVQALQRLKQDVNTNIIFLQDRQAYIKGIIGEEDSDTTAGATKRASTGSLSHTSNNGVQKQSLQKGRTTQKKLKEPSEEEIMEFRKLLKTNEKLLKSCTGILKSADELLEACHKLVAENNVLAGTNDLAKIDLYNGKRQAFQSAFNKLKGTASSLQEQLTAWQVELKQQEAKLAITK